MLFVEFFLMDIYVVLCIEKYWYFKYLLWFWSYFVDILDFMVRIKYSGDRGSFGGGDRGSFGGGDRLVKR